MNQFNGRAIMNEQYKKEIELVLKAKVLKINKETPAEFMPFTKGARVFFDLDHLRRSI
ncbi:hypothetical protein [Paenibacillus donghaensis]|uniref:hypothetical protein n=1 Tax=Paenibacillus donghaensis TaxID=414771 RepID=UPI0012FC8716|nr:hypothetical protein [Paenibacillus donghaensis]